MKETMRLYMRKYGTGWSLTAYSVGEYRGQQMMRHAGYTVGDSPEDARANARRERQRVRDYIRFSESAQLGEV